MTFPMFPGVQSTCCHGSTKGRPLSGTYYCINFPFNFSPRATHNSEQQRRSEQLPSSLLLLRQRLQIENGQLSLKHDSICEVSSNPFFFLKLNARNIIELFKPLWKNKKYFHNKWKTQTYIFAVIVYLYVYNSGQRSDTLLYGLDTGATGHSLHSEGNWTQAAFLCHDCFV